MLKLSKTTYTTHSVHHCLSVCLLVFVFSVLADWLWVRVGCCVWQEETFKYPCLTGAISVLMSSVILNRIKYCSRFLHNHSMEQFDFKLELSILGNSH